MFDLLGATVTPSATKSINKTAFLFPREKIMTTLALNIKTMSSRDLLNIINTARAESGEPEIRLNKFNEKIEDELEGDNYTFSVVTNPNNTESKIYQLSADQCMLLTMRESKKVRRLVLDELKSFNPPENSKDLAVLAQPVFESALVYAKLFNLEGNQALLAADKATERHLGFSPMKFMQIELVKEVQVLNLTPTQIGKELNPPLSAVATNKLLSSLGFQEKLHDQWVPTAKGKAFAIFLDTGKKHSDGTPITQLKWLSTLIPHLA